jgi:hypothetical protein
MHAVRHRPHPFEEALSAESELGWHEPLAHALERYAVALAQLCVASAVCGLTLVTVAAGVEDGVPVVLASAATGLVLAARVAMRSSECRERALDMIVAGRAGVRVAVVQREVARALDPKRRESLAGGYDSIADERRRPRAVVVEPLAVAQVRTELERVTRLLRAPDATARGVAAAQRLLCDGTSSMFGRDAERLREDLHRVAYLLSDRADSAR